MLPGFRLHRVGLRAVLVLCAFIFTSVSNAASAEKPVALLKDGKAVARVYVPPLPAADPKAKESAMALAVRELNYHLGKMSGAPLEVVQTTDAATIKAPAIVLGEL